MCYLIRLRKDEVLYKQNKKTSKVGYIILYGYMDLLDEVSHRKIGSLGVGDTVGEEALLDNRNQSVTNQKPQNTKREETAIARNETFLFEIEYVNFLNIRD